jgi:hypothetical protein
MRGGGSKKDVRKVNMVDVLSKLVETTIRKGLR